MRIIQDERAVRKNPKLPDYSGLEFVENVAMEAMFAMRCLGPSRPERALKSSTQQISSGETTNQCKGETGQTKTRL